MASLFYKSHSKTVLWAVALTLPLLMMQSNSIPTNNEIETWLPQKAEIRRTFDEFKRDFGNDESVLIAFPTDRCDRKLIESVAQRMEALPGIRHCWSAERLRTVMQDFEVPEQEIARRLNGFVVSEDGKTVGLIALLSAEGVQDRLKTVQDVRQQLTYCQFSNDDVAVAGAPVVVAELDRLGNSENNQQFFFVTLLICLGLLYYSLRDWKVTTAILVITIWAINLTTTLVKFSGGEMNFILNALAVMVMVFTLAICVHFLHYFRAASDEEDPCSTALRSALKPCCLATLTTTIGLLSLTVSDIGAVKSFGVAASIGSVVALLAGLGLMPAVLTLWPPKTQAGRAFSGWFAWGANWLLNHKARVAMATGLLVAVTSIGLFRMQSHIEPLDFLPKDNKVLADVHAIEGRLVKMNAIEAVVDFGNDDSAFMHKLQTVQELEQKIAQHPSIHQTTSAATFFPTNFPKDAWKTAAILKRAESRFAGTNDYIADGERLWRISARIDATPDRPRHQIIAELREQTTGHTITFTGMSPLLEEAQQSIFDGFWDSFLTAFAIITLVMIVSLRSWKAGLIAMIPNLTPLCIVFGVLGWLSVPVDIGMMMTGSIALGIAVDGTFHFLVRYNSRMRANRDSHDASRDALIQTGAPILKAAVIAAIGMLALTLSNFVPTARFGYMMATLLMAALIGDLMLLPAILALRSTATRPIAETQESDSSEDNATIPVLPLPHIPVKNETATRPRTQQA